MANRSFRSNFSSGLLDPKLANRSDVPQYRAGLRTGTNVMLLPHGGFRRRPGLRMCRQLTGLGSPEYEGRGARFRFNLETQYVLHFRDERLDVYQGTTEGSFEDTARITRIRTPYTNALIPGVYLAPGTQTADTMVICHQSVPPHRLLRSALRATNPVETFLTSTVVRIYHPDHKLLNGDEIGLSGLEATGGITAARLNTFQEVVIATTIFIADDISTTSGDETLTVTLPSGHGFVADERITFAELDAIGGFTPAQLNRTHTVATAGATTITIEMPLDATSTDTGGTGGEWKPESFYTVDIGGSTTGIIAANGGGTAGRAWVLHSLAPDEDRETALEHLPQHDFQDSSSPQPKNEQQRLVFDGFANGDTYKMELAVPLGAGGGTNQSQTPFLDWTTADIAENARILEEAFSNILVNTQINVTVTYDTAESSGDHHEFTVEFTPAISITAIGVFKIRSTAGTIAITRDVEGGSTEEDVISTTRGWPAGCIFYQRRLWFFGLASRPSTILASKIEDFFDFALGTAADSDAIEATGEFDRIRHMIAERGLWALTSGSEVEITGGEGSAITPSNINLRTVNRYGATAVRPVSVAGRPIYIDRTGRTVRQLGFSADSGAAESKDISILSQFLIGDPVAMEVWRNEFGDYACVVCDDGTMAVLNINVDQAVAGWTKWTTDGSFLEVVEAGDILYVIVERSVNGSTVYFLEAFDFDYHTDCALSRVAQLAQSDIDDFAVGLRDNIRGYSHLEGETLQIASGGVTLETAVVASGAIVPKTGDVLAREQISLLGIDAGLAIPTPTAEPMPPVVDEYTSITKASVDLFESRGVRMNGYKLPELLPGGAASEDGMVPLVTGWRSLNLMGWGDRKSVTLTFPEPQPALVRAILMEAA